MPSQSTCALDGCDKPARCRGRCNTHYARWRRTGSDVLRTRPTDVERFWSHVSKDGPVVRPELGPCWPWTAGTTGTFGYGCMWWENSRAETTHRIAYIVAHGSIPVGLEVLHRCDNPPCCNNGVDSPWPSHLFAGTQADNARDMREKGRGVNPPPRPYTEVLRGEAQPIHKLSDADVREIRRIGKSVSQRELGRMFGVSQSVAGDALNGTTWKHVQ